MIFENDLRGLKTDLKNYFRKMNENCNLIKKLLQVDQHRLYRNCSSTIDNIYVITCICIFLLIKEEKEERSPDNYPLHVHVY